MYQIFKKTVADGNNCSAMERETILKNRANLKSQMRKVNIKIIFAIFFCFFCVSNVSFAQVVGSYSLSYLNKQYNIEAYGFKNEKIEGKFHIHIQVSTENPQILAAIRLESTNIDEFAKFLLKMKEKDIEWSSVSIENNVTNLVKSMDFTSSSITFCWENPKLYFSFGHELQPKFVILESGETLATIHKKVTAYTNQYINEEIYWVFSNEKEIDDLVTQLDLEKIRAKLQEKQNTDDLFK
jgi:hypothetical protein